MYKFIKDLKIIYKCNKKYIMELITMSAFMLIFGIFISYIMNQLLFLLIAGMMPLIFFVCIFPNHQSAIREVEKEIELEKKYKTMYDKFIKLK